MYNLVSVCKKTIYSAHNIVQNNRPFVLFPLYNFKVDNIGAEEMGQWLKEISSLAEDLFQFLAFTSSSPLVTVTTGQEDQSWSSGLCKN